MPAANTFTFRKGEDVEIDWTIRESDSDTAAVADITGWTFSFKVKRKARDADPSLVTATTTIVDAANGEVKTTITAADLAMLAGDYQHSLWRTNAGSKACLSEGIFSVLDTVES